jgi:hypothetical protein
MQEHRSALYEPGHLPSHQGGISYQLTDLPLNLANNTFLVPLRIGDEMLKRFGGCNQERLFRCSSCFHARLTLFALVDIEVPVLLIFAFYF